MQLFVRIFLLLSLIFLISCSTSYEKLSNNSFNFPNSFSKHLFETYKEKADFEAKKMYDWDSTKLFSEKALDASMGKNILPQKISYWKITPENRFELIKGYNNLMTVYNEALINDPYNLARAISSLDCWSEQQEEIWQIWDIKKCRDDYLNAMHAIYGSIDTNIKLSKQAKTNKIARGEEDFENKNFNTTIVTKDKEKQLLQIIYFDFNKSNLSNININEIKNYINLNKKIIKKFIIIGHTDTVGTKEYNYKLSIERALAVEKVLLKLGIKKQNISIFGKGETDLLIKTNDEIAHPINRRAEISPLN